MSFDIAKADAELRVKTIQQIQTETAYVWASRAIVCYDRYRHEWNNTYHWLRDGDEYAAEAIEHAGLAGPTVYQKVWAAIEGARPK